MKCKNQWLELSFSVGAHYPHARNHKCPSPLTIGSQSSPSQSPPSLASATDTQQTSIPDRFFFPSDSQSSPSAVSGAVCCLRIDMGVVAYS